MKPLKFFTEAIAWLQIALSPSVAGFILGAVIYASLRNTWGIVIGISIALVGIITGGVWATKVWKKKGTVEFMSKVMATPELNKENEESKQL